MIGSKNEVSTPGIDCPGTSATPDWPVETTLTWLMPVSAGWIDDLHVLAQLLDQAGRQRDPHPGPKRPLDLDQVEVDHVAGIEAGDAHRAADADALARRGRPRRSSAAAPGSRGRRWPCRPGRSGRRWPRSRSGRPRRLAHRRSSAHLGFLHPDRPSTTDDRRLLARPPKAAAATSGRKRGPRDTPA